MAFQVRTTDPDHAEQAPLRETALEFPSLEDALFQSFLLLDAGRIVSSITGPDVELTRDQIKRKWRAARQ